MARATDDELLNADGMKSTTEDRRSPCLRSLPPLELAVHPQHQVLRLGELCNRRLRDVAEGRGRLSRPRRLHRERLDR